MDQNTVLIVGSIALDSIETPSDKRTNVIGGSTTYSLIAASRFSKTSIVGIVGSDFPKEGLKLYETYADNLEDLKINEGSTFRWGGKYHSNWDDRDTLYTDLGVFLDFNPVLSEQNQKRTHILLANIHPELQLSVIEQNKNPKAVIVVDTMNLWIETTFSELKKVLTSSNILLINESESKLLTKRANIENAAEELLGMGPEIVVIKKGSEGAELFSNRETIKIGAFPVKEVIDPTGAGDVFAGTFIAALAEKDSNQTALLKASAMASFSIESFGVDRLINLSDYDLTERTEYLKTTVKS
tara:strand:+ start:254 stop:1150 length:897 start_codon:yes stop_codon:yes gene_type:complete